MQVDLYSVDEEINKRTSRVEGHSVGIMGMLNKSNRVTRVNIQIVGVIRVRAESVLQVIVSGPNRVLRTSYLTGQHGANHCK